MKIISHQQNNSGSLLYCVNCQTTNKPQVLGRLLNTGELLVLRFHSGTTLLKSDHISLSCGCGFTYLLSGTVVQGTIMLEV